MFLISLIFVILELIKENNITVKEPVVENFNKDFRIDEVVDRKRYNKDVEVYGIDFAESMKKIGVYRNVRRESYVR